MKSASTLKEVGKTFVVAKYNISGTIESLAYSALDGDVPNPDTPDVANDLEPFSVTSTRFPTCRPYFPSGVTTFGWITINIPFLKTILF